MTTSSGNRVSEQARHDAVRRAELAEAGRKLDQRDFAARLAAMKVALDQMQAAVTTARAERDAARDEAAKSRRDIDGFVDEIRDLNDQLAAAKNRADGATS